MGNNVGYRIFSKAVHNEAMRTDPPEIYGWRAVVLAMSVCCAQGVHFSDWFTDSCSQAGWGAMLFGMDSSIISGVVVAPSFQSWVKSCLSNAAAY